MADQEQATHTSFPNPPPFWQDFTPDRLERIRHLRKEYAETTGAEPPVRLSGLPEDLTNLQPPEEPADGRWRCFGDLYTLKDELPTLEDQNIQRVIPAPPPTEDPLAAAKKDQPAHADRALVLKRLSKSLLLNFLELVGIMASKPDHGEEKVADITSLFMNMEHAINEYRPHQAREQLIQLMQERLDRTRAETAALRAVTDKAKRVLEGLGSIEIPDVDAMLGEYAVTEQAEAASRTRLAVDSDHAAWSALDATFA